MQCLNVVTNPFRGKTAIKAYVSLGVLCLAAFAVSIENTIARWKMSEPQYLDGDNTARGIDDEEDDEKDDSYDTLEELEGLK